MATYERNGQIYVDNPGVFWRGADGNVWVKGHQGTNAAGGWNGSTSNYWRARGFVEIPNPSGGGRTAGASTSAPSYGGGGGGGGGGAPAPVLNEGAIRNTQRTIDEIPGLLAAALASEARKYQNAIADFKAQEKTQRGTYDKSTTTNQLNYDANFMDSIRAGIKGLGGLMNILRGTGAAGGTVEDEVQDVVGRITSQDIRAGADTQKENQGELDSTLSTFLTELARKREVNEDAYENNQRAIRRDSNTQLQDLYGKMAGYYGAADRNAEANTWLDRAGSLTPSIARNSRTQVSRYDTSPVKVKAPELTAFAEPSQPDAVSVPSDGQVGSGIFTMTDRKRSREPELAGV